MNELTQLPQWLKASESALTETLKNANQRLERLADQAKLWAGPGMFVVSNLPDGPDYPEPLPECTTDAFVGLSLGAHAYYKTAVTVLRQQFELCLLAVLLNNRPKVAVLLNGRPDPCRKYLTEKREMPAVRDLLTVFGLEGFSQYRHEMEVLGRNDLASQVSKESAGELYGLLCSAAHSRFGAWNIIDWDFSPLPAYSSEKFVAWADLYEGVQSATLLWVLLAYPGMFQWINENQTQNWSIVFDNADLKYLATLP